MKKKEISWWLFIGFVIVVLFIRYFIPGLFSNRIFEWPLRLDVKACWNEQVKTAKDKAVKDVINLM